MRSSQTPSPFEKTSADENGDCERRAVEAARGDRARYENRLIHMVQYTSIKFTI